MQVFKPKTKYITKIDYKQIDLLTQNEVFNTNKIFHSQ